MHAHTHIFVSVYDVLELLWRQTSHLIFRVKIQFWRVDGVSSSQPKLPHKADLLSEKIFDVLLAVLRMGAACTNNYRVSAAIARE